MSETIFTKIINKEIPAEILYEDEISLAFKDINPQAPMHFLVIPKKAIATINDIDKCDREVVGHLSWVAAQILKEHGLAEQGYRTVMNTAGKPFITYICTCWPVSRLVGRPIVIN